MRKGVFVFWTLVVATAGFRLWQSFHLERPDIGSCLKKEIIGTGEINDEPVIKDSGQLLIVSVHESHASAVASRADCGSDYLLRMKTKIYPRFQFGDEVRFTGKINLPMNFESDNGREFDYRNYLAKDDIYFEIKSAVVTESTSTLQGTESRSGTRHLMDKITGVLYAIKRKFVYSLDQSLGEPHSALAKGLVVGEKASLPQNVLDDFRRVGLTHVITLSGYNITIVGDALAKMLQFLPRLFGIFAGGAGIMLFGVMVGGGATVVRSCFMAGVALSANAIRRDYNVLRALIFAGLIMIIENPAIFLHDISFQLSFLATLGLIMLASPIEKRLGFITERFSLRSIVAATLATQLFVSPFILYTMGQLSIVSIVVNLLILPTIPFTMLLVSLTGVLGMIYLPVGEIFGLASHILLSYELFIVKIFAKLPFASVELPPFSGWFVAVFYAIFFLSFILWSFVSKRVKNSSLSASS